MNIHLSNDRGELKLNFTLYFSTKGPTVVGKRMEGKVRIMYITPDWLKMLHIIISHYKTPAETVDGWFQESLLEELDAGARNILFESYSLFSEKYMDRKLVRR